MEKKNAKKIKLILTTAFFFILVAIVGYVFSGKPSYPPPRIYFKSLGGAVLFTHQKHANSKFQFLKANIKCADCHHELLDTENITSCEKCHKEEGYSAEDMEHKELVEIHSPNCTTCHPVKKKPIVACSKCHFKSGEPSLVSCNKCHPDEGYSAEDFTHGELEAVSGHTCLGCHKTRRMAEAIHTECNRCHKDLSRCMYAEKDKVKKNNFECLVCHLKSY